VDRNDHYVTAGVGANYTINNHVSVGANYTYFRNWSDLSSYSFQRHSIGVSISTRW
jgi:opacity protein-like surface antigen